MIHPLIADQVARSRVEDLWREAERARRVKAPARLRARIGLRRRPRLVARPELAR